MAKKTQKRMPRRREEFTYRGYSVEDLQQMALSELLPLMPARARRKFDRGLSREHEKLLADVRSGDANLRTHLRDMIVMPEMVGKTIEIHNGKEFQKVEIQPEATRRRVSHGSAGIGATRSSKYVPLK